MFGSVDDLVADATSHFHRDSFRARLVRTALRYLLETQLVRSSDLPGKTYLSIRGSGMGLPQSSNVANSCLVNIAENVGFYDQSTFIRQFTKHMGILPAKYRKMHQ